MKYEADYTLDFKGTPIPMLFNRWTNKHYCKRQGIELEEMLTTFKLKNISDMMLIAHEAWCKYNNQPFTATDLDAELWFEESGDYDSPKTLEMINLIMWKASGMSKERYEEAKTKKAEEKKA